MRITLEIAVSTPAEAAAAASAGADRLELCSALELGGLTPSLGVFGRVRELAGVPVWVLLRPRPGGFVYDADEIDSLVRDARRFMAAGADGIVVGSIGDDGCIDEDSCRQLCEAAGGRIAFHRAMDFVQDQARALESLIALGFVRVLTSGGESTAMSGRQAIADLVARAAGRIAVMPGGGIRPGNVAAVVRDTGCREVHASARGSKHDACLALKPHLAAAMGGADCTVAATDPALVAALRGELDRLSSLP